MGANKPAAKQTLRIVTQEQALLEDDGDILTPLRRVYHRYLDKVTDLNEKIPGPGASDEKDKLQRARMLETIAWYNRAADLVAELITNTELVACPLDESAPVDKTEEIDSRDAAMAGA